MALLDMAFSSDVHCVAVHINYHKRETAQRDEQIVKDYCSKHQQPCFIFNAPEAKGNFQDTARQFRYLKCAQIAKQVDAQGVMVAHHLLDDVETFLIQKQRGSQVTHYGLKSSTVIQDVIVERPLLKWMKENCINYCFENKIDYGIDESNLSDDYLRNRIRKELMSQELSQVLPLIIAEKDQLNLSLEHFKNNHHTQLNQTTLTVDQFHRLSQPLLFLQSWIRTHVDLKHLSDDHLNELLKQISGSKDFKQKLGSWRLIKQYGQISLLSAPQSYTYSLKTSGSLKTPEFEIVTEAQANHAFFVEAADFPLTIRNAQAGEVYHKNGVPHKLSRWFISHKIPQSERERWPVVLNCKNEVIHIFRIRLSRSLNTPKTCLYMIK